MSRSVVTRSPCRQPDRNSSFLPVPRVGLFPISSNKGGEISPFLLFSAIPSRISFARSTSLANHNTGTKQPVFVLANQPAQQKCPLQIGQLTRSCWCWALEMFQSMKHPSINSALSFYHHHLIVITVIVVIPSVTTKYLVDPKSLLSR